MERPGLSWIQSRLWCRRSDASNRLIVGIAGGTSKHIFLFKEWPRGTPPCMSNSPPDPCLARSDSPWHSRCHSVSGTSPRKEVMPRDIPVSNGNLLVNFDLDYCIRDIYFPWIGQENHTQGHEFRFGIWVDGCFAWMGPEWEKDLRYRDDNLVTETFLKHERLGLALRCQDAVDFQLNVYVKHIQVIDLAERARDVRLFFSHDFHLYGHEIGDIAYSDPRTESIIHYKLNRYFLANCCTAVSKVADYFSCGVKDAAEGPLPGKTRKMANSSGVRLLGDMPSIKDMPARGTALRTAMYLTKSLTSACSDW